jgi:phosphopantothenoylcysteine decarboxylase/phosphopantothenate--cysteine ligase
MSSRARDRFTLCDTAVVAVTGSIGALWAAQFVVELRAGGYVREIRVVMSQSATQFVTPVAMRALSGASVLSGLFDLDAPWPIGHVQVSDGASVMLVMPATANIIGKAANGIADDAVSASIMAAACPVVFVPNMNPRMWARAAVQRNIRTLGRDGHHVVPPVAGTEVATGQRASGGMPDLDTILKAVRRVLRSGARGPGRAVRGR